MHYLSLITIIHMPNTQREGVYTICGTKLRIMEEFKKKNRSLYILFTPSLYKNRKSAKVYGIFTAVRLFFTPIQCIAF